MSTPTLVIDTNIVLDLWGFNDPLANDLRVMLGVVVSPLDRQQELVVNGDLQNPSFKWIATVAMRDELLAVLEREPLQLAFAARGGSHLAVFNAFEALVSILPTPSQQPPSDIIRCSDADDQKFIDLALSQQAILLSKDRAVLKLRKRLLKRGVVVASTWLVAQTVKPCL